MWSEWDFRSCFAGWFSEDFRIEGNWNDNDGWAVTSREKSRGGSNPGGLWLWMTTSRRICFAGWLLQPRFSNQGRLEWWWLGSDFAREVLGRGGSSPGPALWLWMTTSRRIYFAGLLPQRRFSNRGRSESFQLWLSLSMFKSVARAGGLIKRCGSKGSFSELRAGGIIKGARGFAASPARWDTHDNGAAAFTMEANDALSFADAFCQWVTAADASKAPLVRHVDVPLPKSSCKEWLSLMRCAGLQGLMEWRLLCV